MISFQNLPCYFILSIITISIIASCATTDIRTVQEEPRAAAERTTAAESDTVEHFMELTVGLIDPVDNFDPLFASDLSTMRVLSLIYDGLLTLDENGDVTNAIAIDVAVSGDSLMYALTLNTDLFFHDNTAFTSGIGRRIHAADVKWALERTANLNVPTEASALLFNIVGYEEFYKDQRNVYDPGQRVLDEVIGITVEDPQTIQFRLIEPDSDFLNKLASPYLFIYPREAAQAQGASLKSNPVGTGAYHFDHRSDNRIILTKNNSDDSYDRLTQPRINRINFENYSNESEQFQQFVREDIDWIPEIGPETHRVAINSEGKITTAYHDIFKINYSGSRMVNFHLNSTDRINMAWLENRLIDFYPDTANKQREITIHQHIFQYAVEEDAGEPEPYYLVTFTNDLFARDILTDIQTSFLEPDTEFRLSDIRVPVLNTAIYTTSTDSFHVSKIKPDTPIWFTLNSPVKGLHHPYITGIENHNVPWKFFVESIQVEETNGENQ